MARSGTLVFVTACASHHLIPSRRKMRSAGMVLLRLANRRLWVFCE